MDVFCIEALQAEIGGRLAGARIDKVHQPEPETLVLRLWTGREELRLLLSAFPGRPRCHLTTANPPNPPAPPRFCQLLRARLARIETFGRIPGERILRTACRGRDGEEYVLFAELLGAHPDLVLVDGTGVIVDALRRSVAGGRENLPGLPYRLPVIPPRIPLEGPLPGLPAEAERSDVFQGWLLAHIAPMSPLVARDLAAGVARGEPPVATLNGFRRTWQGREFHPRVGYLGDRPVLSPFPLRNLPLKDERVFGAFSEAADYFYALAGRTTGSERRRLVAVLASQRRKLQARLGRIQAEKIEDAGEEGQRLGELLMANLHRLQRGMREVSVDDIFRDPPQPVVIPLDPLLSPAANAERYFQRRRKEHKGREHRQRRLAETLEEIACLEEAELALEEAVSATDIAIVRGEMEDAGLLPAASGTRARRRPQLPDGGIRQALSPGGFAIFWGKTAAANDRISRELTGPDDLWFHAHRLPGCHLVLKRGTRKEEVPETDILYAAAVAAGYSRGKNDSKVEVMVSRGRHVRRPKGGRPGLVTVENYRTVMVMPLRLEEVETLRDVSP